MDAMNAIRTLLGVPSEYPCQFILVAIFWSLYLGYREHIRRMRLSNIEVHRDVGEFFRQGYFLPKWCFACSFVGWLALFIFSGLSLTTSSGKGGRVIILVTLAFVASLGISGRLYHLILRWIE